MPLPHITVVGSFVMDLVVWLDHLPRRHETQPATRFARHPGGKGFNQALTARRCGARVDMIGKLGADSFGDEFVALLAREDIGAAGVSRDRHVATSFAMPMILADGDNSIVLIQQANLELSPLDIDAAAPQIQHSDILMLQLEVPIDASVRAAQLARQTATPCILNPAPAHCDIARLLPLVDWLIPNEVEAEMLCGVAVTGPQQAAKACRSLLDSGVRQGVVITLGAQGAVCVSRDRCVHIPAFAVKAVDSTGAGDAFCGAFATALASGSQLDEALRFGSAAGAHAVGIVGAEPSLPRRASLQTLLQRPEAFAQELSG